MNILDRMIIILSLGFLVGHTLVSLSLENNKHVVYIVSERHAQKFMNYIYDKEEKISSMICHVPGEE
jgi:hypothetical protein